MNDELPSEIVDPEKIEAIVGQLTRAGIRVLEAEAGEGNGMNRAAATCLTNRRSGNRMETSTTLEARPVSGAAISSA